MYAATAMYLDHFGLREAPFSLAPDPRYLYLSGQHREALAHLLYGVRSEGGFVQLTGEVGTGKTTVCRCFLEQLPPGTRAAVIMNPSLTTEELLAAICDEFEIPRPAGRSSIKTSLDLINRFLLDAHAAGERAVLVIDEAQNLDPAVLERLRLLTNLETSRHKLLQIILMGQPELRATLARPDLRQLAQRITARFHLRPLSGEETAIYVRHRLAVAGCHEELFPAAVIRRLRWLSRGVPRLINILCDRALLGAYVQGKRRVDRATLDRAAREVAGKVGWEGIPWRPLAVVAAGCVLVAAIWFAAAVRRPAPTAPPPAPAVSVPAAPAAPAPPSASPVASVVAEEPRGKAVPMTARPASPEVSASRGAPAPAPAANASTNEPPNPETMVSVAPEPAPAAAPAQAVVPPPAAPAPPVPAPKSVPPVPAVALPEPAASLPAQPLPAAAGAEAAPSAPPSPRPGISVALQALMGQPGAQREEEAWRWLYRLWGIRARDGENGCTQALVHGLDCLRGEGGLDQLRGLDRPAIVRIFDEQGAPRWLVLERLEQGQATFAAGGARSTVDIAGLAGHGIQGFALLWRPPSQTRGTLAAGDQGPGVRWLAQRLETALGAAAGSEPVEVFDAALAERVRDFQHSRGLPADGVAGPAVLLALDTDPEPGTPTLAAPRR